MTTPGFTIFETSIGPCGIAWNEYGVAGVQLPEASELETRARLQRNFPDASEMPPPPEVETAIAGICALLRGDAADLSGVVIDLGSVPAFHRRVYEVVRTIPPGDVCTYGEIASRLGDPGAARAVGQALGSNPFVIIVPCHRVLAAGGKLGGFSASGGTATKLRLLSIEASVRAKQVEGQLALFKPRTPPN